MQLISNLTSLMALSTLSTAYVVTLYEREGCKGTSKRLNVWDNSCADADLGYRSFKVEAYGAGRQRAFFYKGWNNCWANGDRSFWADGGSDNFKKEKGCINIGFEAHELGSWSR